MQRPPLSHLILGLFLGLLSSACSRSSSFSGPPVFSESEVNDSAFEANDFGILRPGDHFIIRGDISDLACDPFDPFAYCDPFDGFAFTAGEPISVDFRLYADRAGQDFDVCLYDPFLDLTVDCFQSPNNPEAGGVDVFGAGFDFHLVVESFFGTGGYELEIEVYSLFAFSEEDAGDALAQDATPIRMSASTSTASAPARANADHSSFEAYSGDGHTDELAAKSPVGEFILIEVDDETGESMQTVFTVLADGTLQPKL